VQITSNGLGNCVGSLKKNKSGLRERRRKEKYWKLVKEGFSEREKECGKLWLSQRHLAT